MFLQAFELLDLVFILIASILLWLMLWLATRLIVTKSFASDKKFMLLIAALLTVVLVPLVAEAIMYVLNFAGEGMRLLRNLVDPNNGGSNYIGNLAPIIAFLIFYFLLRILVRMDWKDTLWVSLIGIFLLFMLYSLVPELDFRGFFL